MLAATTVLPVVLIFYIKVGIPLRILYDSYRYSVYFRDRGNWKNPRSHVIGGILNAYLLPEASNLQAKRIYKNSNSKWNFNPHPKIPTSHLLERALNKPHLVELVKQLELGTFWERHSESIKVKPITLSPFGENAYHMTAIAKLGEGAHCDVMGMVNLTSSLKFLPSLQQSFTGGSGLVRGTTGLILAPDRSIKCDPERFDNLLYNDSRSIFKASGFGKFAWMMAFLHPTSHILVHGVGKDKPVPFPFEINLDIPLKKLQLEVNKLEFNAKIINGPYGLKYTLWRPELQEKIYLMSKEEALDLLLLSMKAVDPKLLEVVDSINWFDDEPYWL